MSDRCLRRGAGRLLGRAPTLVLAASLVACLAVSSAAAGTTVARAQEPGPPLDRSPAAVERAADLIVRMSDALRTLDYEGTFVHQAGDSLTSLAIVHSYDGEGELERLSALDGEAREVFRNHSLVTCIWPDSRSVVVTSAKPRKPLPVVDATLTDNARYALALGPDDRVAGRAVRVVEVVPRDALRYGYRFWIDRETDMLLRSMLLDERGRPIEQVLFTTIDYPDAIAPDRFEIASSGARSDWVEKRLALAADIVPEADEAGESRIAFASLPEGYRTVSETHRSMPIDTGPITHVMLTDGMAAVSVYVEHVPPPEQQGVALGHSRMGAVNAFGVSLPDAFVTAVGEVPAETVRRIALATRVGP